MYFTALKAICLLGSFLDLGQICVDDPMNKKCTATIGLILFIVSIMLLIFIPAFEEMLM